MSKKVLSAPNTPQALGPYSNATSYNGLLFLAGQMPIDPASNQVPADIKEQITVLMKNMQATLKHAGADFKDILSTTIYLTDLNDYQVVNEVYASFFDGQYPARATVGVKDLLKDCKVEIAAIAALPEK